MSLLRRTEGIVLKSFTYGEADLIMTYLTRDYGQVRAFAQSARKIKSRFSGSLEPLTHARISLRGKEDATLPRLTQSDILTSFQPLREDFQCYGRVSGMLELTMLLVPEAQPDHRAFDLLLGMLGQMQLDCSETATLMYRVRLLKLAGFPPRLGSCIKCGAPGDAGFDVSQGSVLCANCAGAPDVRQGRPSRLMKLSVGSVKLYQTLLQWEVSKVGRIKASPAMFTELASLLDSHVEHITHRALRAKPSSP